MYDIILKIGNMCFDYIDYIDEIGNECAYTDRIVEAIYEEAEVLHKKHDESFEKIDIKSIEKEISKMIDEQLGKEFDEETKAKFFKRIE